MLLLFGNETVRDNWYVGEKAATVYTRMYFVNSGEVSYKDNTKTIKLKKNHLYCFPTDKTYSLSQDKNNKLNCLFLHLSIFPYHIPHLVEISFKDDLLLKDIKSILEKLITQNRQEAQLSIMAPITEALTAYLKANDYIKLYSSPIVNALEMIAKNPQINYSVNELSLACAYNDQYFIRLFKKELGVSPHQYILFYKMNIAIKLLQSGQSISRISDELGFNELRSFGRCFKKQYGMSPTEFKKYVNIIP